ncbi:Mor transcription activator family protein [Lachnospiraceae bacterium 54-11]
MDYLKTVIKNLKIEDLPLKYQDTAQTIGLDNYIALCECLGGSSLYIPSMKEVTKEYVYRKVRDSKGIMSKKQLARAYGLSLATVYNLLKDEDN